MAFTSLSYGFYNYNASDEDPKVYDALDVSRIFDGIITDGIYENYKHGFVVKASEIENQIIIGSGRAWFDHTWSYLDADTIFDLTDYPISSPYTRIDAVVIDVDTINRVNSIKIVTGAQVTANPVKPTLINEYGHVQHALCFITREGGVNVITQDKIQDVRGQEAYNSAFVTGVLSQMTIDDIVAQWETEFDTWSEAQRESFLLWRAAREEEFVTWFNQMKGQLSTDAAGNLQEEIDSIDIITDGVASATTVSRKLLKTSELNMVLIPGTSYMEATTMGTIPVAGTGTITFTNEIIHQDSDITVKINDPRLGYNQITVSEGSCSLVITNPTNSALQVTVRIYIQ